MDDLAKLKDKAAKLWSKGNWGAAAEAYEELFKADSKNLMHRLRVGDALVKQGKTQDAIKVYGQVADQYAAEGQLIKAISVCKLILQLDSQQKDTQKRLAALYSKRGVATVASRASASATAAGDAKKDMDLPDHDGQDMVIETPDGEGRAISASASTAPNAAAARAGSTTGPTPSPMPGPGPSPAPPASARAEGVAGIELPSFGPPGPIPAPSPSAAPGPSPVASPAPFPAPSAPPVMSAAVAAMGNSQARASEIIELGPTDVVSHHEGNVSAAVEQAKADLKEAGNDVDLDALFSDVGEIPKVPPTPLFSDLQPAEFERLIELLSPIRVPENTPICREGEPATSMFVVAQGSVNVYFNDPAGKKVQLAKLTEGEFFGEFALFEGGVRKASVEALEETELLELSKENFDKVVSEFPGVANVLRMFYYARLADTFLARSSTFGSLSRDSRWEFVRAMTLQLYNEQQPILREGETGDALFMIRTGVVSIWSGAGSDAVLLAELPAGEIFGEIAVISLQPRTATVYAKTAVEVYRLDRESARKLLGQNRELATKIKEIAEARVRSTIDAMISGSVGNTGR